MSRLVRRAFARIGQRFVHYRHAGTGPVVVLLHQSPQNSSMWAEQMTWLARDYRVLAPDLPGFGHSDPLNLEQPSIADLSAACHAWLDALGIGQCAVFGMHTGGIVAVHMGLDRPERVELVMVDGYALFSDNERKLLGARYLPPFQPDWSGQHLRWLWARMREQSFFFPWCEQEAAYALRYPAPDTVRTQTAVMDILEVGDHYRLGYRAALQFSDRECVATLAAPARLFYRDDDVLTAHRDRLPPLPAHIRAPRLPDRAALWAAVREFLAQWKGETQPQHPPVLEFGWQRQIMATELGDLAAWVWFGQDEPKRVRLVLHGPGQSAVRPKSEQPQDACCMLIQPDLPGHGASGDCAIGGLEETAEALIELCLSLGWNADLVIEAHQGAAVLGLAVARRWPACVEGLVLVEPWMPHEQERIWLLEHLPDLSPRLAGGHLLEAWQWERERHLYPPWKPPLATHRLSGPAPDVERVHANTVTLIGLGEHLARLMSTMMRSDLEGLLLASPYPIRIDFDPRIDDGRLAALDQQIKARQAQGTSLP